MNNYEIKYDSETFTTITSVDGVELHEGHVIAVKEDYASYISDASKDAYGSRYRFNCYTMSIVELEEMAARYSKAVGEAIDQEEKMHAEAEARFEANIENLIESGAGSRETAIRWIREAHADDAWCDLDECIRYALGLSWSYDLDHGDRDFFKRQAALAA